MKIQKPTLCRAVIFTASRGEGESSKIDEYAGEVVGVSRAAEGIVDIVTHGPNSTYHNNGIPHDADGKAGTWRYPPRCDDTIDV